MWTASDWRKKVRPKWYTNFNCGIYVSDFECKCPAKVECFFSLIVLKFDKWWHLLISFRLCLLPSCSSENSDFEIFKVLGLFSIFFYTNVITMDVGDGIFFGKSVLWTREFFWSRCLQCGCWRRNILCQKSAMI